MLVLVLVLLYVVGFVFTLRHTHYRTRVNNENRYWMEQKVGPHVLNRDQYRLMHLALLEKLRSTPDGRKRIKNHDLGDLAFRIDPYGSIYQYPTDWSQIYLMSLGFPMYWGVVVPLMVLRALVNITGRPTPGQLREAEEFEKWEQNYRRMKTQHLYEETERLRREQDGD